MLRRRRTYGGDSRKVTEKYGYFMKNCEGNSTDLFDQVFLDENGDYTNPVYQQYGADRKTGEFPRSLMEPAKTWSSTGEDLYVQKSYTDGSTIVLMMALTVYISYNGGVSWIKLFSLGYGTLGNYKYTGNKRVLFGQFVYFDSSYIYLLFSTSPSTSSVIGYNTTQLLLCTIYNRTTGNVETKQITTLPSETITNLKGTSTLTSPDGIICLRLETYWSDGNANPVDSSGYIKYITINLPAVARNGTQANWFKRNSYKVIQSIDNNGYMIWGNQEFSSVWVYDGSTYGAFLNSSELKYTTEGIQRNNVTRLAISASSSKLTSVTLSVISSNTSDQEQFQITEHCAKNVNNQVLVMQNNGTITIRNATTWAIIRTVGSLMDLGEQMYGTKYPSELSWYEYNSSWADIQLGNGKGYSNPLLHGGAGFNITPDGRYYVFFTLGGHVTGVVVFVRRADDAVMIKSPFIESGINRNQEYIKYMIPRVTLDGTQSGGSGSDPVIPDPGSGSSPTIPSSDIIDLNDQWQVSSVTYSSGYTVYESDSNHNQASQSAIMYITPSTNKTIYIMSDGESTYDYATISDSSGQLDSTSGNQQSWRSVSLTAGVKYTITYRKDSSVNQGADRGYVAIQGTAKSVSVNLNSQWKASSSTLSGYTVWESYSNKGTDSSNAYCIITISGYTSFTFKVRNYSETDYDYVTVNNLDDTTSAWTSNVYYTNKGKSSSTDWYDVTFSGITDGQHQIKVNYGKDVSQSSGDDCGYLAIANSYL